MTFTSCSPVCLDELKLIFHLTHPTCPHPWIVIFTVKISMWSASDCRDLQHLEHKSNKITVIPEPPFLGGKFKNMPTGHHADQLRLGCSWACASDIPVLVCVFLLGFVIG